MATKVPVSAKLQVPLVSHPGTVCQWTGRGLERLAGKICDSPKSNPEILTPPNLTLPEVLLLEADAEGLAVTVTVTVALAEHEDGLTDRLDGYGASVV